VRLALGEDVEGDPPKLESEPIVQTNSSKPRLSLLGGKRGLFNNAETLIIEQRRLTLRFRSSVTVNHCSIRVGLVSGPQKNDRRDI